MDVHNALRLSRSSVVALRILSFNECVTSRILPQLEQEEKSRHVRDVVESDKFGNDANTAVFFTLNGRSGKMDGNLLLSGLVSLSN